MLRPYPVRGTSQSLACKSRPCYVLLEDGTRFDGDRLRC